MTEKINASGEKDNHRQTDWRTHFVPVFNYRRLTRYSLIMSRRQWIYELQSENKMHRESQEVWIRGALDRAKRVPITCI